MTLPIILNFNYEKIISNKNKYKQSLYKYGVLFKIFNVKNIDQLDSKLKSIFQIYRYNFKQRKKFSIPKILFGINERRLKNNPVDINKANLTKILEIVRAK